MGWLAVFIACCIGAHSGSRYADLPIRLFRVDAGCPVRDTGATIWGVRAVEFAAACAGWLNEVRSRCRPRTVYECERRVVHWLDLFAGRDVATMDRDTLRGYIDRYRTSHRASTTNHELSLLRWLFSWIESTGSVVASPARHLRIYPEERRPARVLFPGEVSRLLLHAPTPEIRALIVVALETGFRQSTLLSWRWEWIDFDAGWVHLPASSLKSREALAVPVSRSCLDAIRGLPVSIIGPVWPWKRSQLQRLFDGARRKAGVECTFHDLRRTFFSRLRERHVPLEVAMKLSDHRDIKTALQHYRAISPNEMLKAVGRAGDCDSVSS